MKQASLLAAALLCVCFFTAEMASAQTYVAGPSPQMANPQPATEATLTKDANRLIRWQGWLNVDAFSISVLEQMQKHIEDDLIEIGKLKLAEPAIKDAVKKHMEDPTFTINPELKEEGVTLKAPKLYVWTYRHNYSDTGLHQLYVSIEGEVLIGTSWNPVPTCEKKARHKDIQSLAYEFGEVGKATCTGEATEYEVCVPVEIWRGAVVRVNARGEITVVGNEAGVIPVDGKPVEAAPISEWERAPSLVDNPNYKPIDATGAEYIHPLRRKVKIQGNEVQSQVPINTRVGTKPMMSNGRW